MIAATLRKEESLRLRLSGMQYREIAEAMIARYGRDALPGSYDERFAWRDVQDEMKKHRSMIADTVNDLRIIESERLDQIQLSIMPEVLKGNLKAIDRMIRIMDHRAKLFGLYAPAQLKVQDWRTEILDLVKSGKITIEQVEQEIGPEYTQQLLNAGGNGAVEGRFTEEESPGPESGNGS